MALSPSQLIVLNAHILANPVLAAYPNTNDMAYEIAAYYAVVNSPAYWIWARESVDVIIGNGFDWTRIDNLSVGKARIISMMFDRGYVDCRKANERAGVLAAFTATADAAIKLSIFSHCSALASRGQKLFSTGTGLAALENGTGPSSCEIDSQISHTDVYAARNLP